MHALGGAALLTTNATALTSGSGSAGGGRPTTVGFLPWRAYAVFHTVQHERLADLDDVHHFLDGDARYFNAGMNRPFSFCFIIRVVIYLQACPRRLS